MQRERLDKLSDFRLQPNALNMTSSGPQRKGGNATVVQATFQRRIWGQKKHVAVKKLAYHRGIDRHRFANVRIKRMVSARNLVAYVSKT